MFQALCEASASSGPCGDRFSNVTAVGGCAACTKERRWLADGETRILRGCYQDQTQLSGDLGSGCKRCFFSFCSWIHFDHLKFVSKTRYLDT